MQGRKSQMLSNPGTGPLVAQPTPQPTKPNSEVYAHIDTERIVGLNRQGVSQRKIGKLLGMSACSVGNRLRKNGIRGGRVVRVTKQQLRDARLDPALEARLDIRDRVICRECGELKASINANGEHSHLRRDRITVEEYTRKYPGARFFSFAKAAEQARRQGRNTTLKELMQQFAAKYLAAVELRQCRRDPFWERHHGMTDIVVCRRCGLQIGFNNLSGHVRRDGYEDLAAYRADFPNAPSTPIAYKERYLRPYAKERHAAKLSEADAAEQLVRDLRADIQAAKQTLADKEAKLAALEAKLGRPRTMTEDQAKYGPKIAELRAQRKSWTQVRSTMNRETGQTRSVSGWRHLVSETLSKPETSL
jgi:hypothetical protein